MLANKNNLKSELTANVSSSATSISITSGEGVLWEVGAVACLEHYENNVCTKREMVKITAKSTDTFTVTRGFADCIMNDNTKEQGHTAQTFSTGDFLTLYLSKELWESIATGEATNQSDVQTMLARITAPQTCINNCLQSWKNAIDGAYRSRCGGTAGFGSGADGDCIITTTTYLDAGREYNFNNLTICPNVAVYFEGAGIPTINVWNKFCNLGTIHLKSGFVSNTTKTDCWLSKGTVLCNQANDLSLCCGGQGGCGYCASAGSSGYNGTSSAGGQGGTAGDGTAGGSASGFNGGKGADAGGSNGYGGGGGGGGGGRFGNGGNGGNGGYRSQQTSGGNGGNGGNSGLWGTGGTGGCGGTASGGRGADGGNGGNGYCGGAGGYGSGENGAGGAGGCGVLRGGNGGRSNKDTGGKGGDAITNVYGFHLNARQIYNNVVNASGGQGGNGGSSGDSHGGDGGNGANGGQMIISYETMLRQGTLSVSGGSGGSGGTGYKASANGNPGCGGTAGWVVLCSI